MATLKIISTRLKSIKNIQKITKSMKMVSAAKYTRVERELREARPHGDGTQKFYERLNVPASEEKVHKEALNLIIALSSDRGLCGPVHTNVSKYVKSEVSKNPKQTKIVCIGEKSKALLHYFYAENIVLVVNDIGGSPPTFLNACDIAQHVRKMYFTNGEIVYNKFINVASNTVAQIPIYSQDAILNAPKSVMYDSLELEVLESYLEFSLASLIFYALKENACSEQASRMTAMDNASRNAGEMIDKLNLHYNRTRQAAITRELIEIISGAAALKKA